MNVYTDTSTIGGCFDKEFEEWSVALFEELNPEQSLYSYQI